MRQIYLGHHKYAKVDDDDYQRLSKRKWAFSKGYATTVAISKVDGKRKTIGMHRLVIGSTLDYAGDIDHINRNKLDNRKCNLRFCTHQENQRNRSSVQGKTSIYKGVSWRKATKKWRAQIVPETRPVTLGDFYCEIKAAKAYDEAAKQYHGEFAVLNFPQQQKSTACL